MFNLSMASKELFHSNMLYWISQTYPKEFMTMLNLLNIDTSQWPGKWESHREKDNIDLSVTTKNSDSSKEQYLFILENKVKSIPFKSQLDKYKQETVSGDKIQYLLLSLCTKFANEKEIRNSGWEIANYSDLATAIDKIIKKVQNTYHRELLNDYSSYIKQFHQMQERWTLNLDDNYRSAIVDADEDIKQLNDVKKKLLVSKMAQYLLEKIPGAILAGNKEIEIKKKGKTPIPEEIKNGKVFINFGMTRSTGLVDLKVRVKDNLFQIIQVQGKQFKHCVEVLDKESEEMKVINSLEDYLKKGANNPQLPSNEVAKRIIENQFLPFHLERIDSSVLIESKSREPFNHYGRTFIYQYLNIRDDATVRSVLDKIIVHVNSIVENIKKSKTK